MRVSSDSEPDMLHREADECMELLAQASFSGIIALLMERADRCRIMADRIVAGQGRPEPERDELVKAPELDHEQRWAEARRSVHAFPWRPAARPAVE
jgi:hypothetical protein